MATENRASRSSYQPRLNVSREIFRAKTKVSCSVEQPSLALTPWGCRDTCTLFTTKQLQHQRLQLIPKFRPTTPSNRRQQLHAEVGELRGLPRGSRGRIKFFPPQLRDGAPQHNLRTFSGFTFSAMAAASGECRRNASKLAVKQKTN